MNVRDEMATLSARLGLMDLEQDWGIANGDPERLEEFIAFYESECRTKVERYAMADLILASANDRLDEQPNADLRCVARVLARVRADATWEFDHWLGLEPEHFPLAGWLREWAHDDTTATT